MPASIPRARRLAATAFLMMLVAPGIVEAGECPGGPADDGHDHGELAGTDTRFALVDEAGSVVVSQDLYETPSLIYFGYAFCPDICPVDNARNAAAVDILAERGISVRPIFITVDPTRDTPEAMAEYTGMLHPEMIGLSGTVEQIDAVAASFGVFHTAAEPGEEYYLVDHSTFSYFVMPGGELVDRFGRAASAADLAERMACHISLR